MKSPQFVLKLPATLVSLEFGSAELAKTTVSVIASQIPITETKFGRNKAIAITVPQTPRPKSFLRFANTLALVG